MQLLETILYEPGEGFYLLNYHLDRLTASATFFNKRNEGFEQIPTANFIEEQLNQQVPLKDGPQRVRLLLGSGGDIEIQHTPLSSVPTWISLAETSGGNTPLKIVLDCQPIESHSRYVTNKTTRRDIYNAARERAECDFHAGEQGKEDSIFDVLLYNEQRQITETSIANIAVEMRPGYWVTPTLECGLLAGIFRRYLLQSAQVHEGIVSIDDVTSNGPKRIVCFNSVRKLYDVELVNRAT
ncbi:hypothetical protein INT43_004896 [Umbelopsis isabellina]|uniref:Aminodeoxychorismate lyase n=1 Tax=Mortierella isabellina TaxID=91625 RepID=A0A8H7PEU6_MORIS|nr:hypothetical protein INT43_004896 [Umbelopsis isabellina]